MTEQQLAQQLKQEWLNDGWPKTMMPCDAFFIDKARSILVAKESLEKQAFYRPHAGPSVTEK